MRSLTPPRAAAAAAAPPSRATTAVRAMASPPPPPAAARLAALEAKVADVRARFPDVPGISPRNLRAAQAAAGARVVVVDVREAAEIAVSRIPGALSAAEFERRRGELLASDSAGGAAPMIVTYCTVGVRSAQYARKLLRGGGAADVRNLDGSILAWTHAQLPLEEGGGGAGGAPTRRVHVFASDWALQADGYEPVVFDRPLLALVRGRLPPWLGGAR
jgi:rhodanese-related sulfurtransferase